VLFEKPKAREGEEGGLEKEHWSYFPLAVLAIVVSIGGCGGCIALLVMPLIFH